MNNNDIAKQLYKVKRILKKLKEKEKNLSNQLKENLSEGEVAECLNGMGYQVTEVAKVSYPEAAVESLFSFGPLATRAFVSITQPKLKAALKEGLLKKEQYDHIQRLAVEEANQRLSEIVIEPVL